MEVGGRAGFAPERQKEYIDEAEMTHEMDEALSARKDHLWKLSSSYLSNDVSSIQKSLVQHVEYTLARRRYKFDRGSFYQATAHSGEIVSSRDGPTRSSFTPAGTASGCITSPSSSSSDGRWATR